MGSGYSFPHHCMARSISDTASRIEAPAEEALHLPPEVAEKVLEVLADSDAS